MTSNHLVDVKIQQSNDSFELKISIVKCHNLSELVKQKQQTSDENDEQSNSTPTHSSPPQYWLSYRCFGKVVQSEIFSISSDVSAEEGNSGKMIQTFRLSYADWATYFVEKKNTTLRIHLCTDGCVIATAQVDLNPLISRGIEEEVVLVQDDYSFKSRLNNTLEKDEQPNGARVSITMELQKNASIVANQQLHEENSPFLIKSAGVQTTSVQPEKSLVPKKEVTHEVTNDVQVNHSEKMESTNVTVKDDDKNKYLEAQLRRESLLYEKEIQLKEREDEISKKEKELQRFLVSLEKERSMWEQTKHQEELTWQEKLRMKEHEMMSIIEERVSLNEKERLKSMDKSKKEYEELERRLTKAIVEVEAKDRKLKELHDAHQNEHRNKLSALELREKLIKQEMKHSVEIEQAKANAAIERAQLAEKAAITATKKVKQVEAEMDELREKHRNTPEVALLQELAEVKGHLAVVKAEMSQVLQDKEKFRINVKKLAKALRQERDKAVKRKELSQTNNVRLSYDDSSRQFVLAGEDQNEVNRILHDLGKLTQKQEDTSRTSSPVPFPSQLPTRPLEMDDVLENISLSLS